jgi:dihydroorotate dehydrogenase (NAD+) catalytic subunit
MHTPSEHSPVATAPHACLHQMVHGLSFATPLLNASGAFYAPSVNRFFSLPSALGGIVTKTVTAEPSAGNRPYRTVELPGIGMLNSIGLQNPGLAACLADEVPALAQAHGLPVVLSFSANSVAQFAAMAASIAQHPNGACVAAVELNLSCPNVSAGGMHFGTDPGAVTDAVAAVKAALNKPVWAKLTPNVTNIVAVGQAAVAGGADGLTAINTVMGMALNVETRKPILPRVSGGYSGPGIRPIALHAVWQLRQALPHTVIVGVGGIETAEDVLSFMLAGANLVQVGTACFINPMVFTTLVQQLTEYCQRHQTTLSACVGAAHG